MSRYEHIRINGELFAIDADGNVGAAGSKRGAWLCTLGRVSRIGDTREWASQEEDAYGRLGSELSHRTRREAVEYLVKGRRWS